VLDGVHFENLKEQDSKAKLVCMSVSRVCFPHYSGKIRRRSIRHCHRLRAIELDKNIGFGPPIGFQELLHGCYQRGGASLTEVWGVVDPCSEVSCWTRGIIKAHDLAAASIHALDSNDLMIVSSNVPGNIAVGNRQLLIPLIRLSYRNC
jgi:hypothetical protein